MRFGFQPLALLGLLLACCLPASAEQEPQPGYRISGTVVHGLSGRPLERVRVTIAPIEQRTRRTAALTSADGRFGFAGLPAGKYELAAERRGFLPQRFQQGPQLSMPGVAVVTGPGEPSEDLVFRLYPPAAIWGTVTDSTGEPVRSATVSLSRRLVVSGRRRVVTIRYRFTDDRGHYRFWGLPAGTYYLGVCGRPWYVDYIGLRQHAGLEAYAAQYYPNADNQDRATPIVLKPGAEFRADFTLSRVRAVSVNLKGGESEPTQRIVLTSEGPLGSLYHRVVNHKNYSTLVGVAPGRYTLWLVDPEGRKPPMKQEIEVGGDDLDVQIAPEALVKLNAVIEVEGGDTANLTGAVLGLVNDRDETFAVRSPAADGRLDFPALPSGRYQLRLVSAERCYLKRLMVQGAPYEGAYLDLTGAREVNLKVVLGTDGGRLEGKVYWGERPVPGIMVLVVPRSEGRRDEPPLAFQTDSDGSFEFPAVAPGDYVLVAVEDTGELEYANPAVMAPLLKTGKSVRVEPRRTHTIHLDLAAGEAR